MDAIRQRNRENNFINAHFYEKTENGWVVPPRFEPKNQILAGDYNYINADDANDLLLRRIPAYPIKPDFIQDLLDYEHFKPFFKDLNDYKYTKDNIKLLRCFSEKQDHTIFVNNFNAVHNDQEVVYAIIALKKTSKTRMQQRGPNIKIKNQIAFVFRGSVYPRKCYCSNKFYYVLAR